jgi:hypothetical protein
VWCLGRLQTDADRERVVEGLAGNGQDGLTPRELAAAIKHLAHAGSWSATRTPSTGRSCCSRAGRCRACAGREMSFEGAFDAVLCLGTTLGYFDDEPTARSSSACIARCGRAGLYCAMYPARARARIGVAQRDDS